MVTNFMKQKGIFIEDTLDLMGNYYNSQEGVNEWGVPAEEESVNEIVTFGPGRDERRLQWLV